MDRPFYLGCAVLELSKLYKFETYYDKLQPYFGEKNQHLHYMDTDSFILSVNTKDIIKDLKTLEDMFDFSNLDKIHELFSNKNKKVIVIFKIETSKIIWIDEFVCQRSKMYSFKYGVDNKNKLNGITKSQSKHIKTEEYKNCLDGEKYRSECENYILRSGNHEMFLQQIKKNNIVKF